MVPLALEGRGPDPTPQQAHWARVHSPRSSDPGAPLPIGLSSSSPPSLPPMPLEPTLPEGIPEGKVHTWEPNRPPGAEWVVEKPTGPPLIPWPWMVSPFCLSSYFPLLPPSYTPRIPKAIGGLGGQRTRPGSPAGLLGPSWWGKHPLHLPRSSDLRQSLLIHPPLLFSPPSLLCPRTHVAWSGPWRVGDLTWEPSSLPGAEWAGETSAALP